MLRVQFVLFMTKTFKFQIDIVHYFKAVRSCSVRGKENALNLGNDSIMRVNVSCT